MIVVGLSHRSAPIGVRERLAVNREDLPTVLARFRAIDGVSEAMVLSTCNRMEVYIESDLDPLRQRQLKDRVARALGELGGRDVLPHLMNAAGDDALRHLFRVASSLDSLVLGEPQILGQLKEAIVAATKAGTMAGRLSTVMRSAVQVAKRVRTKTTIGSGQVSVPSVAVDLARHIFEDLNGHTTLVIGAGEMAEAAAKLMARAGADMLVVNRSAQRAIE
ncbi:MAG TPA: glutamyl-tRNA reductase, partial [Sorangium sp.]|nr:glutamyl-tRNA reductase [Sorangium sp.]